MTSRYTSEYGPNVEQILIQATRVIRGKIPMQVRRELMAAVKAKVLGRLPKDGLKPEIFFHPDHKHGAIERQKNEAAYSVGCIAKVMAGPEEYRSDREALEARLLSDWMIIVAGHDLHAELEAEKARLVPNRYGLYDSEALCKLQERRAKRGCILGAEIVQSNYGYSVRYDSGLQDWGLIASSKAKQLDGTIEDAERFAREWVAQDPAHRYAWKRKERSAA